MKTKFLISFLLTAFALPIMAQQVRWKLIPSYSSVVQVSEKYWRVKAQNGKFRLLDLDDSKSSTQDYDSITNFSNEYALGLNQSNGKWLVKAIISKRDLKETIVKKIFYANEKSYFSEGRVCISNAKGQYGYLNVNGDNVIKCKYTDANPFYDGKALVTTQALLKVKILKNDGPVYINDVGKTVSSSLRDENAILETLMKQPEFAYNAQYSIIKEKDLYGFSKEGVVVVEPQFKSVNPVVDTYAKVAFVNNFGIIEIGSDTLKYDLNEDSDVSRLSIPLQGLRQNLLQVNVVEENGSMTEVKVHQVGNDTAYYLLPVDTTWKYRNVNIIYDRLLQKSQALSDKTHKESDEYLTVVSFYSTNSRDASNGNAYRADKENNITIIVRVSNNSNVKGVGKVSLVVDGAVYDRSVSIDKGKTENIRFTVRDVMTERFAKVRVRLSNGKQSGQQTMHFEPFY